MFDGLEDWVIAFGENKNNALGLLILCLGSSIEYVFPPFPGDTIVLAGAVFVAAYDWSFWLVFGVSLLGAQIGALVAFVFGRKWRVRRAKNSIDTAREKRMLDKLVTRFERHGPVLLIFSRFIPGMRPIFLVAAGLAGMTTRQMLLWSGLSSVLWTLFLMGVGMLIGANLEELKSVIGKYNIIVIGLVVCVTLFFVVRWLMARRQPPQSPPE